MKGLCLRSMGFYDEETSAGDGLISAINAKGLRSKLNSASCGGG